MQKLKNWYINHKKSNGLIPEVQKRCHKGSWITEVLLLFITFRDTKLSLVSNYRYTKRIIFHDLR